MATQDNGTALMDGKELESAREIMAKSGIDGLRIVFGRQLSFINANEFLSFSGLLPETVVGNPIKPGRETRFTPEASQILVGAEKSLLGQVVRERDICPDQLPKQTSHARLMIPDQFGESVVVVINKNARNEICI